MRWRCLPSSAQGAAGPEVLAVAVALAMDRAAHPREGRPLLRAAPAAGPEVLAANAGSARHPSH